ncbi:MAG: molybdopterin converting factor subunit 1 [Bacteroidia bacterium]|nr:molybdopterin converting factor subunit 1 [Bacteroidia bacterium]
MNKYTIRAFGITKDIIGQRQLVVETAVHTVEGLKVVLLEKYPALSELRSLVVAVNNQYADDHQVLKSEDEIALIPPVSGG